MKTLEFWTSKAKKVRVCYYFITILQVFLHKTVPKLKFYKKFYENAPSFAPHCTLLRPIARFLRPFLRFLRPISSFCAPFHPAPLSTPRGWGGAVPASTKRKWYLHTCKSSKNSCYCDPFNTAGVALWASVTSLELGVGWGDSLPRQSWPWRIYTYVNTLTWSYEPRWWCSLSTSDDKGVGCRIQTLIATAQISFAYMKISEKPLFYTLWSLMIPISPLHPQNGRPCALVLPQGMGRGGETT